MSKTMTIQILISTPSYQRMRTPVCFGIFILFLISTPATVAQWNTNPSNGGIWVAGADSTEERFLGTAPDGRGGVYVFWVGSVAGHGQFDKGVVYGQHVDSLGYSTWGPNGLIFSDTTYTAWTPALVSDSDGGVVVAWHLQDYPPVEPDTQRTLQMVRIDEQGNVLWDQRLWQRHLYSITGTAPVVESDGAGGMYILGITGTFMTPNPVYLQRVSRDGTIMWPNNGTLIRLAPGGIFAESMVNDGMGGVFISWWDSRNSFYYDSDFNEIYVQHVDTSGSALWNSNGNLVIAFSFRSSRTYRNALAPDGSGGLFLAYRYSRSTPFYHNLAHIWSGGGTHWDLDMGFGNYVFGGFRLNKSWIMRSLNPGNVALAQGNWIQATDTSLQVTWNNGIPVMISNDTVYARELIPDGEGGVFVVSEYWHEGWPNTTANELRIQKFSALGAPAWPEPGKPIATNPGTMKHITSERSDFVSYRPVQKSVVSDGKGGVIAVWTEYQYQTNDKRIYVSRIDNDGNPFPVEFELFDALLVEDAVHLTWRTATETHNFGFHIERKAGKGRWKNIGFIVGQGTADNPHNYAFSDVLSHQLRETGVIHYRLKQEDFDGSVSYSPVRSVYTGEIPPTPRLFPIYPNPVSTTVEIRFTLPYEMEATVRIVNTLGQVVHTSEEHHMRGVSDIQVSAAALLSGMYYIQLLTEAGSATEMFVKK